MAGINPAADAEFPNLPESWVEVLHDILRAVRHGAIATRGAVGKGGVMQTVLLPNTAPRPIVGQDDENTMQVILLNPGTIPITYAFDGGIQPGDVQGLTMAPGAAAVTLPTSAAIWAVAAGSAATPGVAAAVVIQRGGR